MTGFRTTLASRTVAIMAALLCSGCGGHWPEQGQGGMAEVRWPQEADKMHPPARLRDRMSCTLSRFDTLREAADRTGQFNGQVELLDLVATRAKREYAGALYRDSEITLSVLDTEIDGLGRELRAEPPECG